MKYLKQKLMAAAAMLMVSVVMLTSASYAWFTISVTPEVQNIGTSINANENFEIALGTDEETDPDEYFAALANGDATNTTTNDHTWGATITTLTALGEGLGPAVIGTDNTSIETTMYAADGRPKGLKDATIEVLADATDVAKKDGVATIKDDDGNVIGHKIVLWLRSNVAGAVSVAVEDIKIGNDASAEQKIQVAFQWNGGNIVPSVTNQTNGTGAVAVLGTIGGDGNPAVNTAIPVNVYIYMQGDKVSNADMATTTAVTIGKIQFTNAGISSDGLTDKYENAPANDANNG